MATHIIDLQILDERWSRLRGRHHAVLPEAHGGRVRGRLPVFIGRDHMILEALKRGAVGAVTACCNVAPKLFVDLCSGSTSRWIRFLDAAQT